MKQGRRLVAGVIFFGILVFTVSCTKTGHSAVFSGGNARLSYAGRFDFSNPGLPRVYAPGAYVEGQFAGPDCDIILNDQHLQTAYNYVTVVLDGGAPRRLKLTQSTDTISVAKGAKLGAHHFLLCKETESVQGYIEVAGVRCSELLDATPSSRKKIEFIGDSQTVGWGMDESEHPCGTGNWWDRHDAYLSYGPRTARALDAEWMLTASSGIGMAFSCCGFTYVMPQVYDKTILYSNSEPWDFSKYQADLAVICLGQNDEGHLSTVPKDSATFCNTYVSFVETVRSRYPRAEILCLTPPMTSEPFKTPFMRYLTSVKLELNRRGENKVNTFAFGSTYGSSGCGNHPTEADHALIAGELTAYIRRTFSW